jgi:hypothetical protein
VGGTRDLFMPLQRAAASVRPLADESLGGARSEFVSFREECHGSRMEQQLLECRQAERLAGTLLGTDPDPSRQRLDTCVSSPCLPGSGSVYHPRPPRAGLRRGRPHASRRPARVARSCCCNLRRSTPALHGQPMKAARAEGGPRCARRPANPRRRPELPNPFANLPLKFRSATRRDPFSGAMLPRLGCQGEIGGILLRCATVRNIRHLSDGGNQWRGASGR